MLRACKLRVQLCGADYCNDFHRRPSQMGSLVVYGFSINMSRFIKFNPLYWYITAFRTAVLDGEMLSWNMLWICGACAVITLVFGLLVFRKQQDKFVLHI